MKNSEYKYHYNSNTLPNFEWEETLLESLRNTIEVERLVVKTSEGTVLFDGAPNDLPDELLLLQVDTRGRFEYGEHYDTLSLQTLCVRENVVPSYFELANCCIEQHKNILCATERRKHSEKNATENSEILRSLLKLALRKSRCSRLNVYDFVNDVSFVLGIKLDETRYEEDEPYDYDE